jgi:hypothetical protein
MATCESLGRLITMVQDDERINRFLEQALRFEQAAENARDPQSRQVYEELAELWRRLAQQVQALRERAK